jgi:hypothetical protein
VISLSFRLSLLAIAKKVVESATHNVIRSQMVLLDPKSKRLALSLRQRTLVIAMALYAIGVWLHIPYAGGRIYSDLPTVFQARECSGTCLTIPYVNGFIEYPILVSLFIYLNGLVGLYISQNVLSSYYSLSVIFLSVPTLLLVDETLKICQVLGRDQQRVLHYLVLTPTFVFVLLVNWYSIGVYFSVLALRKLLQGKIMLSGVFLGISAGANLITAASGIGMLLGIRKASDIVKFSVAAAFTVLAINAPFALAHPSLWTAFWKYHFDWYIEGSWMLAFLPRTSDLRHLIFPVTFVSLLVLTLSLRKTIGLRRAPLGSWLTTSAFLFSTYVATPQTNLMLLPFFAFLPVVRNYGEFFVFDLINALVIVIGFSQPLYYFGVTYHIDAFSYYSIVQWLAIIRSAWIGKFLIWDGFRGAIEKRFFSNGTSGVESTP